MADNTFGTKVQNAQNLLTHLQTFAGYTPPRPSESLAALTTLITDFSEANDKEAALLESYTLAVDARQAQFDKGETSLVKIQTPIIASIRAQYGKTSKETSSITEKINKIRGVQKPKTDKNPDEKSISTSQQSYASLTQNFADMIAAIEVFSPPFTSPNPDITLPKLKDKLTAMRKTTTNVVTTFGDLDKIRTKRDTLYTDLKERTQRVKESVKAQYGIKSTEYNLIKGLRI